MAISEPAGRWWSPRPRWWWWGGSCCAPSWGPSAAQHLLEVDRRRRGHGAFIYVANPHQNRVLLFVVVVASALIYGVALLVLRVADRRRWT